jgi:hypothetical protein
MSKEALQEAIAQYYASLTTMNREGWLKALVFLNSMNWERLLKFNLIGMKTL